ncbi:AI-2E family transporter [Vaginisenegalia massiliensis]|uniref:AI-2E family transporter n=1 Tax=Vaginisenegalia massiliensis TaxID=2058294 RepID=UPI000F53774E|nr:AI-2E family transporter [Vaginisenegalia massiliensis]
MDPNKKPIPTRQSWFQSLFLNNQVVVSLLIVLLILVNLFIFTKLTYLFSPVGQFINLMAFPIITSGILYYLFVPLVDHFEREGISRPWTILAIFIILILLITWGLLSLYPVLQKQTASFILNLPSYYEIMVKSITKNPYIADNPKLMASIKPIIENFDFNSLTQRVNDLVTSTFGGLGSFVGTITQVLTGLFTIPIILYYLLLNSNKIPDAILYHVPTKYRPVTKRMMYRGNYQISQYIRGQILVGICVGMIFAIEYSVIDLDYATTLAVMAGLLNVIPYVGSFVAFIPALIIALLTSPAMVVKVLIALMIEQTLEGRIIAPQVLGNNMKIHPVTILLVLLTAGKLFGLMGVILGVPGYAIIKVIVTEFYSWYRENSDLYDSEETSPVILSPKVTLDPQLTIEETKHDSQNSGKLDNK